MKTGQHFIFVIIYLLLPIKCIIFDSVSKILLNFYLLPKIIMILIMKILLHNVYKIINLRYPTYVYPSLIFLLITKIECWPVFKQDPNFFLLQFQFLKSSVRRSNVLSLYSHLITSYSDNESLLSLCRKVSLQYPKSCNVINRTILT